MNISFFNTYISPTAKQKVAEVLDSGLLSEGVFTQKFEEALNSTFGWKNTICLNSGTSALHLALDILDIGPGDEVILPAQTFVATGLAILYCGATPVFADICYENGNIDPDSVKSKITAKTKAIFAVHWGGNPCQLDELKALTTGKNIFIIEDAAHALGAKYKQQSIGTVSDMTCFSFQAIKHLSTGDGGAICINNTELYEKALRKKWFGIDRKNAPLSDLGERIYNLNEVGFKYHMNNYAAALGLANLENYPERLESRRMIANYYKQALGALTPIHLFNENEACLSAYWLFGFHVKNQRGFIKNLKKLGVPASVVHQRIDRNSIFGGPRADLKNQGLFDSTQVHIPLHDAIDLATATYIVDSIKNSL